LGIGEPVSAVDGATGEVIKEFPATAGVQEFVYDRGVLYAAVGQAFGMKDSKDDSVRLMALEVASGDTLWEKQIDIDGGYMGGTLAVKGEVLAYCTKTRVHCANAATGTVTCQTDHAALISKEGMKVKMWLGNSLNNLQPTLVLSDDMLYCSTLLEVSAYRLGDGQRIWFADNVPNYNKPSDIFLAAGLVWTGRMTGHDPQTGKAVRTLKQEMQGPMSHDRCYRNRITETYFINSKTGGTDFLRLDGKREFPSPWVRATCGLGIVTANGLLYSSPYSCTSGGGELLDHLAGGAIDGRDGLANTQWAVDDVPDRRNATLILSGDVLVVVLRRPIARQRFLPQVQAVEGVACDEEVLPRQKMVFHRLQVLDGVQPAASGDHRDDGHCRHVRSSPGSSARPLQSVRRSNPIPGDSVVVPSAQVLGPLVHVIGPGPLALLPLVPILHQRHAPRRQHSHDLGIVDGRRFRYHSIHQAIDTGNGLSVELNR